MHEDPLQRRIYFLTFVELLEMIFSQYTGTCKLILDYPKIGGDDIIEYHAKKAVRKLFTPIFSMQDILFFLSWVTDT